MGVGNLRSHQLFCKSLFLLLTVGLMVGCGESRGTVSGTITLNGQPIGPGSVMFRSTDALNPRAPSGFSDFSEDGKYELVTPGKKNAGLLPGEYIVTIDGPTSADEKAATQKTRIPAKYRDPETSGLKVTLQPGPQTIPFDLSP